MANAMQTALQRGMDAGSSFASSALQAKIKSKREGKIDAANRSATADAAIEMKLIDESLRTALENVPAARQVGLIKALVDKGLTDEQMDNFKSVGGDITEVKDDAIEEATKTIGSDNIETKLNKTVQQGGMRETKRTLKSPLGSKTLERVESPEELDVKEFAEKRRENMVAAKLQAPGTLRVLQQLNRMETELSEMFPDIGDVGFSGFVTRKKAEIANAVDELPETKAFQIRIKPMANKMARDIEGGRVTDQDRKIYADSFANALLEPSETNTRLASESIITLIDKLGEDKSNITPMLMQLSDIKTGTVPKVINQVLEQYPELVTDIYGENFEVVQ